MLDPLIDASVGALMICLLKYYSIPFCLHETWGTYYFSIALNFDESQ